MSDSNGEYSEDHLRSRMADKRFYSRFESYLSKMFIGAGVVYTAQEIFNSSLDLKQDPLVLGGLALLSYIAHRDSKRIAISEVELYANKDTGQQG